jgi:hypothetical protein
MASIAHTTPPPLNQRSALWNSFWYVTGSCWFLISFVIKIYCTGWGGGGGQCSKKNLLHCAPSLSPKAKLWALEAHVHKITYGPLIDTALYIMLLIQANPLIGQVGRGCALEISTFFGPKWHSPNGLMPFHWAQKSFNFQGPTPSHLPS